MRNMGTEIYLLLVCRHEPVTRKDAFSNFRIINLRYNCNLVLSGFVPSRQLRLRWTLSTGICTFLTKVYFSPNLDCTQKSPRKEETVVHSRRLSVLSLCIQVAQFSQTSWCQHPERMHTLTKGFYQKNRSTTCFCGAGWTGASAASLAARLARLLWCFLPCKRQVVNSNFTLGHVFLLAWVWAK